jgi:ABC-type histidine transport system ATPase subunit
MKTLIGQPARRPVSTSHVERQNLTVGMQMRRFTLLANAFSKKLQNLRTALALLFFSYNFMQIHQSLEVIHTMEAGMTKTHLNIGRTSSVMNG